MKSQNAMRRNLSNSNPQNVRKMDSYENSAGYGGYDPSKYEENGNNAFGGKGVQNSPPRGGLGRGI
jgi:hypothetical protein